MPVDELTVDEVAHEAGVPVRTIREYQTMGLLPPPAKRRAIERNRLVDDRLQPPHQRGLATRVGQPAQVLERQGQLVPAKQARDAARAAFDPAQPMPASSRF